MLHILSKSSQVKDHDNIQSVRGRAQDPNDNLKSCDPTAIRDNMNDI